MSHIIHLFHCHPLPHHQWNRQRKRELAQNKSYAKDFIDCSHYNFPNGGGGWFLFLTPDHNHPFIDVTMRTCDGMESEEKRICLVQKVYFLKSIFMSPLSNNTIHDNIKSSVSDQQFDTEEFIYWTQYGRSLMEEGRNISAIWLMVH